MKSSIFLKSAMLFFVFASSVLSTACSTMPNVTNRSGDDPQGLGPALCVALQNRNNGNAADLLDRGAPLNYRNEPDGWTPLFYAVYFDNESGWKMLLKADPDVNIPAKNGRTVLMQAASMGNDKLVEKLLSAHAADAEARDSDGRTARYYAMVNDHAGCVHILTKYMKD